jgi:glycosyltransferase involved in cell wall biosynthesis
MLTVQIIAKNNEKHIERCLESLKNIPDTEILLADLGSQDQTINISKKYDCQVVRAEEGDRDKIRNALIKKSKPGWMLYLYPDEALTSGKDTLIKAISGGPDVYRIRILRGDILTKETRLWHSQLGLSFTNPVYENVQYSKLPSLLGTVICGELKLDYSWTLAKLHVWKKSIPTAREPYYYLALFYLSLGRYDEFLNYANHYFFQSKKEDDYTILLRYYLAQVEIKVKKNHNAGSRHLLSCLASRPLMAEFWCLLGDMFLARNDIKRAKAFYENALVLGKWRDFSDDFFVEVSKYEDYPIMTLERLNRAESVVS